MLNTNNFHVLNFLGSLYSFNTIGWSFLTFNGDTPFDSWIVNGIIILGCYLIGAFCGIKCLLMNE